MWGYISGVQFSESPNQIGTLQNKIVPVMSPIIDMDAQLGPTRLLFVLRGPMWVSVFW